MLAAETVRGRWVRRNVDEILRHVIFDALQILFMVDVHVCGMNFRSLYGTEHMRESFFVEIGCSLRLLYLFGKYCWRHALCHVMKMTVAWTWT